VTARAPAETLHVVIELGEASGRIGAIEVAGRQHVFGPKPAGDLEAVFGERMALEKHRFERQPKGLNVQLRWRAISEMDRSYKIFVHVLDPSGQKVVAQRDAEPLDGRAPTPGWLPGELIDDELLIPLPSGLEAGVYPVEIGVYEEKSGERLKLPNGDGRVLFADAVRVD
jgi:hypothetical protein